MSYCHMIVPILSYKVCSSVSSLFPVCNCGLILYRKKEVMTRIINERIRVFSGLLKTFGLETASEFGNTTALFALLKTWGKSAQLANAQTTRSVADPFSSFVTQNLQSICSLCHRNPRFFIKIGDPIPLQIHESCYSPRPMPKAVFVSADCGTAKEKSRTFLQRTALRV